VTTPALVRRQAIMTESLGGKFTNWIIHKDKGVPRQAEVAQGVPGSLRPRIILTFRHYKGDKASAIRLYPRRNPWYSFSGAESTPVNMVLSEGTTEKIPSDTIGNRSRDHPTSSAAP